MHTQPKKLVARLLRFIPMDDECIFCGIISGDLPGFIIASSKHCVAFLDALPLNPGHTLVVPRAHLADIHELNETVTAEMFNLARNVSTMIRDSGLPCDGITLSMSNGVAAEQSVFHAHLHVIPRIENDGLAMPEPALVRPSADELMAIALRLRKHP